MAATSLDALLIALHQGMHEEQLWATFLTLLKRRTNSDYASLIFLQGDVPMHEATELFAGRDVRSEGKRQGHQDLFRADPIRYRALRAGQVYRIDELMNLADPNQAAFRKQYLDRGGVRYGRYMRVGDGEGVSAWAIILRDDRDFGADDEGLLAELSPHLAIAVRNFAAFEDARFRTIMGERALRRSGVCWAAFDKEARFIAADPFAENMLTAVTGSRPLALRRLMISDAAAERAIVEACAAFATQSHASARLATIVSVSSLSMLLLPFRSRPLAGLAVPAMMALWRAEPPRFAQSRMAILSGLFGFSKSEARFADALLQGKTVEEAAASLNLTIKTARQYSKQLYAKAAADGRSDLIRRMSGSVAGLI